MPSPWGINPTSVGKLLLVDVDRAACTRINPTSVGKLQGNGLDWLIVMGINPTSVGKLRIVLMLVTPASGSTPQVWGNSRRAVR